MIARGDADERRVTRGTCSSQANAEARIRQDVEGGGGIRHEVRKCG